ncbi:insulysin [Malassezia sp. CBS 17886]|nr:insulysin [Malassezia sp. CBS 17886]
MPHAGLATEAAALHKTSAARGFAAREIVASSGDVVAYEELDRPMEKPLLDTRTYRLVRLANDLEALIVSDPETDKASAAMDVRVGHLSDPEDMPGMAHFCEHLLFMGTKKYPRENEYSEYLSSHSGSSNAFTSLENTNYFFDVGHAHFEGALDRFAQFFLEPLFDPSCSEREIRAVDSEHKKNLQSDMWRAFQLEKSLCDAAHPYAKFGTGNLATLWDGPRARGLDIRDELLRFHERYYSANMMKLVVLGRESADELTRWVVDKFARVPNKGHSAPSFPGSPLGTQQCGTQVFFRTIKELRQLDMMFSIPEQALLFESKPGQLVSHFLGHEGHGSLLSCLKQRGWANMLSAGSSVNASGFELFKVSIDLTADGYEHYDKVAAAVFQYLDLLRERPIETWMFDEVQKLSEMRFAFKEKSTPALYACALAGQMQNPCPPEGILSHPYLLREFDQGRIADTLAALRPERCRIMLAGREAPRGTTLDQKETWYGTEYTVAPLPPHVLGPEHRELDGLALPHANAFIPGNLDVQSRADAVDGPEVRPRLLRNVPGARLWHKQDDRFFLPKANVALLLRTPLVNASARSAALSRLLVELVRDALTEYSYDAEVAGLLYNIDAQLDGVDVVVSGYNDKLPHLLDEVLATLKGLQVDQQRFSIIKDQVRRSYENFNLEEPYQHVAYFSSYLLTQRMWTQQEKVRALEGIGAADLQEYARDICRALQLEMLVHGNVTSPQALDLLARTEKQLGAVPLSAADAAPPRSLLLPRGSNVAWRVPATNKENVNSSVEYYLQVGDPADVPRRATLALLAQIAQEPCFDQLRTKEQLGYLVFSGVRTSIGQTGFRIIVQSERSAAYLESRIDAFLDQLRAQIERMAPAEFEAHRRSLINKKLEVVKNLNEETNRFWLSIHSGYYDFQHRERDVAALRTLTKEDVLALVDSAIHPSSRTRAKFVTRLDASAHAAGDNAADAADATLPPAPETVLPVEEVSDVHAFKEQLTPSSPVEPVLPWLSYEAAPRAAEELTAAGVTAPHSVRANM